jgi:hypothetical protein
MKQLVCNQSRIMCLRGRGRRITPLWLVHTFAIQQQRAFTRDIFTDMASIDKAIGFLRSFRSWNTSEVGRNTMSTEVPSVSAFVARHALQPKYLNTIDLERHKADSKHSYRKYFAVSKVKITQYIIQTHHCYNMDEKGFLIGHLQKVQRIVPEALIRTRRLSGTGQDGARHWITLTAAICADGCSLPPALIYKAVSSNLQDA